MATKSNKPAGDNKLSFSSVKRSEVPHGRKGKHHDLVTEILADVDSLRKGTALKVPKSAFGESKLTNVRAALNRAAEQKGVTLATSSDDDFFYVWIE
jgi:hypothetical protein